MESTKFSFEELKKKKKKSIHLIDLWQSNILNLLISCVLFAMITPLIIVFVKNVMVQN